MESSQREKGTKKRKKLGALGIEAEKGKQKKDFRSGAAKYKSD